MGRRNCLHILSGVLILFLLYLSSLYSYLLFHCVSELFSIVVAFGIFMVAWNSREFHESHFLIFIGIAYFFVAFLDTVHAMGYRGMAVIPGITTDEPTQLWIAARYIESISLVLAPLFFLRRIRAYPVFFLYSLITLIILASIFYWNIFPSCFVEGMGLTPFKKNSEYIISLILLSAAVHLSYKRSYMDRYIFNFILISIILTILSELFFTAYTQVYGFSNLMGHYLKILSFYFIYRAFIRTGLKKPYSLLFKELKESEERFRKINDTLEDQVKERAAELSTANERLKNEIDERQQLITALRESEAKYSTLVEESLIGVYIVQDGRIVFANDRVAAIYGYDRDEIMGKDFLSLVSADDKDLVSRFHSNRLEGKDEAPTEYVARGLKKDGDLIWILRKNRLIRYNGKVAILGNIIDITERKKAEEELRESERNLRFLSSQILSAEEKVRKRIAQEIHDGIGQYMTAIKFSIENSINLMGEEFPESAVKSLKDAVAIIKQTIDEVRKIVMDLRPSTLDDLGLLPTLSWFFREFKEIYGGIKIETCIDIEENDISNPLKIVVYRVLQEAVNNISKHSAADQMRFCLERKDDKIEMIIEDNGKGFDIFKAGLKNRSVEGFGLTSMRERTELSGGRFSIESKEGKGTKIIAVWSM